MTDGPHDGSTAVTMLTQQKVLAGSAVPKHLVCNEKSEALRNTIDAADIEHVHVEDDPRQWSRLRKVRGCDITGLFFPMLKPSNDPSGAC